MATTDYDFQVARDQIVAAAMRNVGALPPGETLNGTDSVIGNDALNTMVKAWQADRIFLWSLLERTLTLVASTKTYAAPTDPKIISIDKAFYRANGIDTPLDVLAWQDYQMIPDKSATGIPQAVSINLLQSPTIYVYPVPDATAAANAIFYLGIEALKDLESSTAVGSFTARWGLALIYGLTSILSDPYGLPLDERRRYDGLAEKHYLLAKKGERDNAVPTSRLQSAYRTRN